MTIDEVEGLIKIRLEKCIERQFLRFLDLLLDVVQESWNLVFVRHSKDMSIEKQGLVTLVLLKDFDVVLRVAVLEHCTNCIRLVVLE